ncbi:MAG: DUF411 domain-containing protein [Gemmatimonadota bacterium]
MKSIFGIRNAVVAVAAVAVMGFSARNLRPAAAAPVEVVVYKSATCGCCAKWVDHMRANGFKVTVHDVDNVDTYKASNGVPKSLTSCHTALVQGYVVEGHVPADVVQRMLKERPAIVGIAAPGMPAGSPGMEMGGRKDKLDIMAFDKAGHATVYTSR